MTSTPESPPILIAIQELDTLSTKRMKIRCCLQKVMGVRMIGDILDINNAKFVKYYSPGDYKIIKDSLRNEAKRAPLLPVARR